MEDPDEDDSKHDRNNDEDDEDSDDLPGLITSSSDEEDAPPLDMRPNGRAWVFKPRLHGQSELPVEPGSLRRRNNKGLSIAFTNSSLCVTTVINLVLGQSDNLPGRRSVAMIAAPIDLAWK